MNDNRTRIQMFKRRTLIFVLQIRRFTKLGDIEYFIIIIRNLCKFIYFREVRRLQRKSARLRLLVGLNERSS